MRMMAPAILGNAAVLINVAVSTNLASGISDPVRGFDGPVSWLGYAFRFMQLPLGLFGVAIGSATLPSISRSAAAGNMDEFRRTFSKSLGMVFLLTLPSSIGLVVLGKSIIGAIYQGGKFQVYDTQQTATALSCYAIGLVGYAGLKVLNPAFYALGDARTPMVVSILSIIINYGTAVTLIRFAGFGHAGLALATSMVALFGFVVLFTILRARLGGVHGRELVAGFAKVAIASAVMGAAVFLSSRGIERWLGVTQMAHRVDLALSMPLGVAVFYVVCRVMGVTDLDLAFQAVLAPVKRRLRRAR
jgi:putative peptidoglycan lipid II flippase